MVNSAEIHSDAEARPDLFRRMAVGLQPANSYAASYGKKFKLIARGDLARRKCTCDDRPETLNSETAIDGEVHRKFILPSGYAAGHRLDSVLKLVNSFTCSRADGNNGSRLQE